jgi:uncharacterized RmlC-like cupin family protein
MAKTAAKTSAKTAAKASAKTRAITRTQRKPAAHKGASRSKPRRGAAPPQQKFALSHLREADFQGGGLRDYVQYRDLGIAAATHGKVVAHVLRFCKPCDPAIVSKRHYHDIDFQMIYVLKGWIKSEIDGEGTHVMHAGDAWTQPPRVRHAVLDYSDDCELLEIVLPADFKTVELE